MKTIVLSMIFSLAVIVCEQQTLFAALPTYTNVASSLIPIAGADRLIPVPGTDSFNVSKAHYSTQNPSDKETDPAAVDVLQPKDGVSLYDHIHGDEDQPKDGVSLYDHIRGEEDSFIHAREW